MGRMKDLWIEQVLAQISDEEWDALDRQEAQQAELDQSRGEWWETVIAKTTLAETPSDADLSN